jgi:hypothetical protein
MVIVINILHIVFIDLVQAVSPMNGIDLFHYGHAADQRQSDHADLLLGYGWIPCNHPLF